MSPWTDDNKISCPQTVLDRVVSGSEKPFCAIALNCSADLLGNGKTKPVDVYLVRVRFFETLRGEIPQNVHGNVLANEPLAL